MRIYPDKTAASLRCHKLVAKHAHAVWLTKTEKRRRYLADHGYILFRFLLVGVAELEAEDRELEVDGRASLQESKSSDVLPVEEFLQQKSLIGAD